MWRARVLKDLDLKVAIVEEYVWRGLRGFVFVAWNGIRRTLHNKAKF